MRRKFAGLILVFLLAVAGATCEPDAALLLPSRRSADINTAGLRLVARLVQITDTHVVDEESPARFAGGQVVTRSAWRPYEAYSTQIVDGILRTTNRLHAAGRTIDFAVHTGDACDNAQSNEIEWLLGLFDGSMIDPRTGPDDRAAADKPPASLDPHAPFQAQGLYRNGVHGEANSIPWYAVFGNHDVYSIGVFPIIATPLGGRVAPLPLQPRLGIVLPTVLDPTGFLTHGNVTPARPGPPPLFDLPRFVEPNARRAFFDKRAFIRAMFRTTTGPPGHGFSDPDGGASYYSVSPVAGLRLIGLDTCDPTYIAPGFVYVDGSLTETQVSFLRSELNAARDRGELVIVASHHPSASLRAIYGTALVGSEFRALLNEYPNVILHIAGHTHRNRVADRGGYLEIETSSTIDLPQEGRIIEIYRNDATGDVTIRYETFSHIDDTLPPLGDDPLRAMRVAARDLALADTGAAARQKLYDPTAGDPRGAPSDRHGVVILHRHH